jgi:uncharacterized membrane protein
MPGGTLPASSNPRCLCREDEVSARWERYLERWLEAGLIEPAAAARIRAYEAHSAGLPTWRWPVRLAVGLGGLLMAAGVLLFVAAHWDRLSATARFVSVLLLVAVFHVAGALATERFAALATAMHAVGTVCLGAGIFLAGQTFHLQEHWPTGVLLWAAGAWVSWSLLRDWPHTVLIALLTPFWISSEWLQAMGTNGIDKILAAGLLLLAITYLTALLPEKETLERQTLVWLGGLALLPGTLTVIFFETARSFQNQLILPWEVLLSWAVALGLPLGLAWWLRGSKAWLNLLAAFWVVLLAATSPSFALGLGIYGLSALGAMGLIAWGVHEARKPLIYLGLAGFALTVLCFYFSTVMDKLGRAASLAGLGVVFLLGGWILEKARRRLLAGLAKGES